MRASSSVIPPFSVTITEAILVEAQGRLPEVKKRYQDYVSEGGGLKGPYGHMIQVDTAGAIPVSKK